MSNTLRVVSFPLGRVVITPGALEQLDSEDVMMSLGRHALGDWGELSELDKLANEEALEEGARLLSRYEDRNGQCYWIITEADRSVTTILLPIEY